MKIQLKLMGMLKEQTPEDGALELAEDANIQDALLALDVPVDSVHVFMVNGTLEKDKTRTLLAGDELTVLPPVGGG